jgi:hypothetical protein
MKQPVPGARDRALAAATGGRRGTCLAADLAGRFSLKAIQALGASLLLLDWWQRSILAVA